MKSLVTSVLLFAFYVGIQTLFSSNFTAEAHEKNLENLNSMVEDTTARVIGIGGIFFKSPDPKKASAWYEAQLGIPANEYGTPFEFRNANRPDEINYLIWNPFNEKTNYFDPSKSDFMINYRVQNIEGLVRQLKANGVTVIDSIETYDYGKFVHIMDLDSNKIELWEPVDSVLEGFGARTVK